MGATSTMGAMAEAPPEGSDGLDALDALLRKAHRHELVPLAEILDVRVEGTKLDDLVGAIGDTLRRRGANDLANIVLRRGQGPDYEAVLRQLAARMGVEATGDVEALEARLVSVQAGALEPVDEERAGIGTQLQHVATSPPVPLPGCLFLLWLMQPRYDLVTPAVLEVARLRAAVRHRVTVGVVGSPSSGKDAALAAIFGVQTGNVNPVAGSTKAVEIRRLEGPTALYLVNTPGLGDVLQEVTDQALEVMHHIDLYIYIVNAQGGVQSREKADYDACVATGRPVLAVVNKIDTLRPSDLDRYLADAREKLGAPPQDFLAAAFDPLPQLADAPIGIPPIRAWLAAHLEGLGKSARELPWMGAATSVQR